MPSPQAWYGYRRDRRDPRDLVYRPRAAMLPARVDLRDDVPAPMNQGALGSCVLHALTSALRYCLTRAGAPSPALSRLQAYYDVRALEGTLGEDAGCEIRNAIKCAARIGVGRETLWRYRVADFRRKPAAPVYRDAVHFNAVRYQRVPVSVSAVKDALASGLPVIFGVTLFESFDAKAVAHSGVVPMPDIRHERPTGGHAMLAVGYGQRRGTFTVRNSWGRSWGDDGDAYLPEDYVGSERFGGDYWAIGLVG